MTNGFKEFWNWLTGAANVEAQPIPEEWMRILQQNVGFFRQLSDQDKKVFAQRVQLFLATTEIEGYGVEIDDSDRLLVAASAIIPVWAFPQWHYFNLKKVVLLSGSFNNEFVVGQPDSTILGMVGTGPMHGKMVLSKPALHYGFSNERDKRNVGIHEFAHLIDMADGDNDGFPERLKEYSFSIPWFDLARQKIKAIEKLDTNINTYGATNHLEFFAVSSEYFFERPKMLKRKHPALYQALEAFYRQERADIAESIKPKRNQPCPCGSGKKYKRCCMPKA